MRLFQISISAQAVASGRCVWISSISGKSYLYSAASLLTLLLYENINDVIVQKNVINSVCCRNFSIISPRVFRHSVQLMYAMFVIWNALLHRRIFSIVFPFASSSTSLSRHLVSPFRSCLPEKTGRCRSLFSRDQFNVSRLF